MTFVPTRSLSAQRSLKTVAGVSKNGTVTFLFQPIPLGLVNTGNVVIPDSPPGATWKATVLGSSWGTWQGAAPYGPIQAYGGETLQVVGTGLAEGLNLACQWQAVSDDEQNVPPIPTPLALAAAPQARLLGSFVKPPPFPSTAWGITVNIGAQDNFLLILANTDVTFMIADHVSGFYYGKGYASTYTYFSCPILPALGNQIDIVGLSQNGTVNLSVFTSSGPVPDQPKQKLWVSTANVTAIATTVLLPPTNTMYRLKRAFIDAQNTGVGFNAAALVITNVLTGVVNSNQMPNVETGGAAGFLNVQIDLGDTMCGGDATAGRNALAVQTFTPWSAFLCSVEYENLGGQF